MNVKCSVCDTICGLEKSACPTCGSTLPVAQQPQAEFGQGFQAGFNQPQTGFNQPQQGFNQPPSGFGQEPQEVGQSQFGQPQMDFGRSLGLDTAPQQFGFDNPSPSGFSQEQNSFGAPVQLGFNQGQDAFNVPPSSGFGVPQNPNQGGFYNEPQPPQGFGGEQFNAGMQQPGFGANLRTGLGAPPSYNAPKIPMGSDVHEQYIGQTADAAKFADTIGVALSADDSTKWDFKDCLLFILKTLIPIYGLVILVQALIGDTRRFPTTITNYMRASLVVYSVLAVVAFIFSLVVGSMIAQLIGIGI